VSDWLTYTAAAERLGVSAEAVRQLAIRHHWPRRKLNDDPAGRVQVLVPDDFEARPRMTVQHPDEHPFNGRSTEGADVLFDAWRRERDRADLAEKQRDAAISRADVADADRRATEVRLMAQVEREQQRADQAELRADREEQAKDVARAKADAFREERDEAREHAREAERALEALRQTDEERRGKGRWTRLRAAWRGE
jgi:hypothetical protein